MRGVIEERETRKEEGTRRGGRREQGRGGGGGRGESKYLGKKNRRFPWPHLKPQQLRIRLIFHNELGLANLGLPHLLKGCLVCFESY